MERGKLAINRAERAPYRQGVSWSLTPAVASDSWRTPEDMRPLRRLARGARALAKPRVRTVLVLVLVGVPIVGLHMYRRRRRSAHPGLRPERCTRRPGRRAD